MSATSGHYTPTVYPTVADKNTYTPLDSAWIAVGSYATMSGTILGSNSSGSSSGIAFDFSIPSGLSTANTVNGVVQVVDTSSNTAVSSNVVIAQGDTNAHIGVTDQGGGGEVTIPNGHTFYVAYSVSFY
jgi:hypothetical protein